MKKVRSIILFISITAVIVASLYLIYNKYRHDNPINWIPAQESSATTADEGSGAVSEGSSGTADTEPQKAYSFELSDVSGKKIKLADYKDKQIVLNFWATWCPYCIEEMPELQKVSDELKEGKEAVLLTIDVSEEKSLVEEFIKKENLTLPVLLDIDGKVSQEFGISGLPTTIFINRDGTVYGYIPHATDAKTIMATLDKMK